MLGRKLGPWAHVLFYPAWSDLLSSERGTVLSLSAPYPWCSLRVNSRLGMGRLTWWQGGKSKVSPWTLSDRLAQSSTLNTSGTSVLEPDLWKEEMDGWLF